VYVDIQGPKTHTNGASDSLMDLVEQSAPIPVSMEKIRSELDEYGLTKEQRAVFDMAMSGESFFYTGSAGTGKSHTLKVIVEAMTETPEGSRSVFVTASTGAAACGVGGCTLHSFSGIRLGKGTVDQLFKLVRKDAQAMVRWGDVKTLIIDEISMVDAALFDKLEELARRLKKNLYKPFGGIQLILCGDFFQLPPVNGKPTFLAKSWPRVVKHCIELRENFRQRNDFEFAKILHQLRFGVVTESGEEMLNRCMIPYEKRPGNENAASMTAPTVLRPHRADVDMINQTELKRLEGKTYVFRARDVGPLKLRKQLENCSAPRELSLKVGALVVLTQNLDFERGLVNGSQGKVLCFTRPPPPQAREMAIKKKCKKYGLEFGPREYCCPMVEFNNGVKTVISESMWEIKMGNKKPAMRFQIPLMLGWALSIHRCQGMTLDRVEMKLASVWECGQAYVALSRASTTDGLHLINYDPYRIRANKLVIAFHGEMYKSLNDKK